MLRMDDVTLNGYVSINNNATFLSYDSNITDDYLTNINSVYYDFFKSRPDIKVKYIDVSEIDFVENRLDYLSILTQITND